MKTLNNILIVMIIGAIFVLYGVYKERDVGTSGQATEKAVDIGQNAVQGELWKITAYCPCEKCCGKWADGITASGAKAEGKIIAAPPEIPFGQTMYIPSYGWGEVQDRGGTIKERQLDLLFSTHQEALEWGVQYFELEGR